MGSCISKSKPKSSSPPPPSLPLLPSKDHESCFVQDKLVIISSHPPQVSSPTSPSPSSASSSFPCTNTSVTSTTSCSSSASSITSCSSSSSSSASSSISVSKDKSSSYSSSSSSSSSYSNDYLWSCIKENPHLINQATVLDKAHVIPQNVSTNFHTRKTKPSPSKSTLSSSTKKKKKNQPVVHSTPQKSACSSTTTPSSPNIVSRQKSVRRDHLQLLPEVERSRHQLITTTTTSVPAGKRNSNLGDARYSSSPIRRSKGGNNDTCKGIWRINSPPGRKKNWNHNDCQEELGIYKNTNNRNIKEATTRPVIRPSSPQPYKNYMRNQDGLGSRKKQIITSTITHHIYDDDDHHQIDEVREKEAVLSSSCITDNHQEKEYYLNSAVVSSSPDDINNPLISLDCFIFL